MGWPKDGKEVEDKSRSKRNVFPSYRLSLKITFSLSLSSCLTSNSIRPAIKPKEKNRQPSSDRNRLLGPLVRRKIQVDYRRKKQRVYPDGEFQNELKPNFDSKTMKKLWLF